MIDRIAKFFCSLRLTVALLCAGLLLVFVGTMAQVDEGLYDAQVRYFKSWSVWKPTIGHHVWLLWLPGGYLIGSLLLMNLLAAHIKRFQFTWKKLGIHLTHGGLILLLLGQLLTDMLARESAMRLVEGTSSNYSEDFRENELVLTDTSDPSNNTVVSIPEAKLKAGGDILDPALPCIFRIKNYWQNCIVEEMPPPDAIPTHSDKGLFANYTVLPVKVAGQNSEDVRFAALVEISGSKGAIGTFLVPSQSEKEQTLVVDGRPYSIAMMFAPMLGGNLLALAPEGGMGGDGMVTFPEAELKEGATLKHDGLPMTIRVKGYWPKCRLYSTPGTNSVLPKTTQGALAGSFVSLQTPVTDTEHRNLPAIVVELANSTGAFATFLLWTGMEGNSAVETFEISGKTYQLAYQFKRYYTPYRIGLLKFNHDNYKGTDIPSNFSCRVRLVNPQTHEDREVLIKMNSPLRYSGTTFYQAGFDKQREDVTILQVVKNPSWLAPYFACILVGLGLVIQFSMHLIGFATKRRTA
jgi:hypothetical protein